MQLSIVIPAFNEENRLKDTVEKISQYLKSRQENCEMIIVDDGSTDATLSIASKFSETTSIEIVVLRNETNEGKGFSVRKGILATKGEYVVFSDADMSTPIEEIEKLLDYTREGYDIVIGSRAQAGSKVAVPQAWYRRMMGKTFNCLAKLVLLAEFDDTQCGFKVFKGSIAREIASNMKINGFSFDVEMLYLAVKKGYRIKEVGVTWRNSPDSKVKVISSSVNMFFDLFRIKRIHG